MYSQNLYNQGDEYLPAGAGSNRESEVRLGARAGSMKGLINQDQPLSNQQVADQYFVSGSQQ